MVQQKTAKSCSTDKGDSTPAEDAAAYFELFKLLVKGRRRKQRQAIAKATATE